MESSVTEDCIVLIPVLQGDVEGLDVGGGEKVDVASTCGEGGGFVEPIEQIGVRRETSREGLGVTGMSEEESTPKIKPLSETACDNCTVSSPLPHPMKILSTSAAAYSWELVNKW